MCVCVCVCVHVGGGERESTILTALGAGETAEVIDLIQSKTPGLHTNHRFTAASTVAYKISKKNTTDTCQTSTLTWSYESPNYTWAKQNTMSELSE